jgi:hypothetical protein
MRQKMLRSRGRKQSGEELDSIAFDPGASVRQVGLIESGTGAMHGPLAIVAALVAAVTLAGVRAWWRANTRTPGDRG